jgi:two-component system nitrogen regulation response regulator NtrX
MPISFRQDLFDRLAVIPLDIPALTQRREDIAPLCGHFLHQLAQTQDLPPRSLTPDALAVLEAQVWPGNLRQLRNTLERALIFGGRDEITAADVSDSGSGEDSAVSLDPSLVGLPLRAAREAFEKAYLAAQIQRFDGNISRTAQFVEMERSALHRKIRALGIAGDDG